MAGSNKEQTLLKKMLVKKFRNMTNVEIDFGKRITIISGRNGTAKSTILGLVAQIFSFNKDYTTDEELTYQTLNSQPFKSKFRDHFRLSKIYDKPGEMDVLYEVYDAYLKQNISDLQLGMTATTGRPHRTVVRNNLLAPYSNNTSRNVTHPVIYLSLKRLYPISERNETTLDIDYLTRNANYFIKECNDIIGKRAGNTITSTKGSIISSSVVHGSNYDNESVSSGEDNVGQIVQALFSFKRLSEEYPNYHGGILIIDELDAGLFPFAQGKIIDVLKHYAKKYNIQIIASTHSPLIIEKVFDLSKNNTSQEFKSIFLSSSHGKLEVKSDYGWSDIFADLNIEPIKVADEIQLPPINVYCEDREAFSFLERLLTNRKIKKVVRLVKDVSLGSGNFKKLSDQKIPEFTKQSIIVLDGDAYKNRDELKYKNIVFLPSSQPPDRLAFRFLFELPADNVYWHNRLGFNKPVFETIPPVGEIIARLNLNEDNISDFDTIVQAELDNPDTSNIRSLFKAFYKSENFQKSLKTLKSNPFEQYLKQNPSQKQDFEQSFLKSLKYVLYHGHGVSKSTIQAYFDS